MITTETRNLFGNLMRGWCEGGVLRRACLYGPFPINQSMKSPFKLIFLTAVVVIVGGGAASADDQQLQKKLAAHRAQVEKQNQPTTIAVHSHRGVGRTEGEQDSRRAESKFVVRSNAKGHQYGAYVPVK